jgi:RNA polymerase sigma-70 factor (ECF subfamily)
MLIEQCKAGDRKAQYQVYQAYSKAMFNICLRLLNQRGEAEDALQEAFIRAFMHLADYKGDASFGAWLKRIVVNECLNRLRKKKDLLYEIQANDTRYAVDAPPSSWETDEQMLEVEKVKQAIQKLPDGYRAVLSLYLLEGYDHLEIAEILHITESTSKSQLNRAKHKLKEILAKH